MQPGSPALSATILAVDAALTRTLDISPLLGRDFRPEEQVYGGPAVVLLAHRFWQSRFGGDPAAVGRMLILGSVPHTIVGVLPLAADRFPIGGADVWSPLTFPSTSFLNQRGSIALSVVGRLQPQATIGAAQDELSTIAGRLAQAYPETNQHRRFTLAGLQDAMVGPVRPLMWLLAG